VFFPLLVVFFTANTSTYGLLWVYAPSGLKIPFYQ
jgi:hypothetical protein